MSEDLRALRAALRAIAAVSGVGAPLGAVALRELEARLELRLPPAARALHELVGGDPRLFAIGPSGMRLVPATALRIDGGVLVVAERRSRGASGEEWGEKVGGPRSPPRLASPLRGGSPLGRGAYVERASSERPWSGRVLALCTALRGLVTSAAIAAMPIVRVGRIRLRSAEAKERITTVLRRVGGAYGARTFVDEGARVLVWNDWTMDRITLGAFDARSARRVGDALSAELRPRPR